jgi:chromate transporter
MTGATFYLMKDNFLFALFNGESIAFADVVIVASTFLLLRTNRIPAPYIVIGCLLLGWLT